MPMAPHGEKKINKKIAKKDSALAPKHDKSFKKTKKEEKAAPFLLEDEDPAFPRGGGRILSREEEAEARAEADAEFEREEKDLKKGKGKGSKKGGKKKKKRTNIGDDEMGSLFGEGISGKLPRFANRITLKNVSPKMKLWGVIVEVNPKDLVISLPGGLKGFVRAEDVSDIVLGKTEKDVENNMLCDIFHVGQLVSCVVLKVDDDKREGKGNKRIWLSLRLSLLYKGLTLDAIQDGMALTAQVKSVEDHGYILHFGVSSISGFLPRGGKDGGGYSRGTLLQCVTKSIDKNRGVIHLSADPEMVSKSVARDLKGLSIDLLIPGMMVNARVHSTLENGIMLSFLTYFTGTVDLFHLQNAFPTGTWKEAYSQQIKVNARILFIDPSTRAVGLTLNSHLVHNKAPPSYVKTGEIYDDARIVRVDREIGLLLEIPSSPVPSAAYVSIFDVADEESLKLEKKYKEGSHVRLRVIGFKHLEGLAIGTLKASALEGSVFTHSDVKPGMLVKAKIIAVESFGAIVQFPSGVKALCPLPHMSELEIVRPAKKFKVGSELMFRVLGCKSKRITVTHKKTLVKSKLNVLAAYADATEGLITHGWIAKIEKHGCFLKFYNGVQGFAHRSELGLQPGIEAASVYHPGQVVKCRIIGSVPTSHKINISFVTSTKSIPQEDAVKVGTLVSGIVERVLDTTVVVQVNSSSYMKGTISTEHLADHHGQGTTLRSALKPGYKFDELLVIDVEGHDLVLSAKYSLISSCQEIPADIAQVKPLSVVPGYICNIIETGCFVRFLGRLTGFSLKYKATDEKIDSPADAFELGQSVRSHILNVNVETGRIKLSLQQSLCFSTDVSFIRSYFLLEDKIATLQSSDVKSSDLSWVKSFSIGNVVEAVIQEKKEFGLVLSFKDHADVVGFVANHQCGKKLKEGSVVKAFVLDISKTEGLVDLSLKPEFIKSSKVGGSKESSTKKKRRRDSSTNLELQQTVNAVVEIVKDNYLILSIPEYGHVVGYASVTDYNVQKLPNRNFVNGQSVLATVGALPSPDSCDRLLLLLKSLSGLSETSTSKRAKKRSTYEIGSLVESEIIDIKPLELVLRFGNGLRGRLHITEVNDDHCLENPFGNFRIGQLVNARIVASAQQSGLKGKGYDWDLSTRPLVLTGSVEDVSKITAQKLEYIVGDTVTGYVVNVENEWVWLTVSRSFKAQLYILDSSSDPSELMEFQERYSVGQPVKGRIITVNKDKKSLRLTSSLSSPVDRDINVKNNQESVNGPDHITKGSIIGGKIKKLLPGVGGLVVQIGPHLNGRVHYTELVDTWDSQPLSVYKEGQFVKCMVLEVSRSSDEFVHVDLSLRASLMNVQHTTLAESVYSSSKRIEKVEDLQPGMEVQGYVKNVTVKGCFIMLSRNVDARILLTNLSDGYIESPEKEFPVRTLVHGRVLSVDPSSKRVDVTLKKDSEDASSFSSLQCGDIIHGQVKRTEAYGLFIKIDNSSLVGLCHISEISDDSTDDVETKYKAGDRVVAKILKIDEERHRISLGMKKSYIGKEDGVDTEDDTAVDGYASMDVSLPASEENGNIIFCEQEDGDTITLSRAESRAYVPPLQVELDESDASDEENGETTKMDVNKAVGQKTDRRAKKKGKEERELEISACEERNLQKDIPRTEEEFERLVRSSPNSSYVWVQYMAFMESLGDIKKARSIAERALKTINFREEGEKLNVWTACFNLENQYGDKPEDEVKKTFHRALQVCDPKKVHLALLGMYERTEQHKLAEELLERMTKRFKTSCKVWLQRVQVLLKHGKDEIQPVVARALLSLPRKKHIKFISQTAVLEFKIGLPDRGRSMFEGVLREYPKRTDLWSVYLDQEIRLGNHELTRALFERVTCLSLPPKKMKFLFAKYLNYEKSQEDNERIEYVTRKAMEYAESLK